MLANIQTINENDGAPIAGRVVRLPRGTAGVRRTLELIRAAVHAAMYTDAIRALALQIVAPVAEKNALGEVQAVQTWVRDSIRYVLDAVGSETLQAPAVTLATRQGDCDDQTALVASLLSAIGHTTRIVAVGMQPGRYAHVFCEARVAGKWMAVETTEDWPVGRSPAGVVSRMTADITAPADADAVELAGFFSKLKSGVKKVAGGLMGSDVLKAVIKNPGEALTGGIIGFASGGPAGAAAGFMSSGLQAQQQRQAGQISEQQYRDAMQQQGAQLAMQYGRPDLAPTIGNRLASSRDAAAEMNVIIAELATASATPQARAQGAALAGGGGVSAWISQNQPLAIGGGIGAALLLALLVRR